MGLPGGVPLGATAVNLIVRDMPKLSVDIDLTYVDIAERDATLYQINGALMRIKGRIEDLRPSMRVQHKEEVCKLLIDERVVMIKIEVNMVGRGLIGEGAKVPLCKAVQEQFDVLCAMLLVPLAQLYGGKGCAAIDRQHPRDRLVPVLLFLQLRFHSSLTQRNPI